MKQQVLLAILSELAEHEMWNAVEGLFVDVTDLTGSRMRAGEIREKLPQIAEDVAAMLQRLSETGSGHRQLAEFLGTAEQVMSNYPPEAAGNFRNELTAALEQRGLSRDQLAGEG